MTDQQFTRIANIVQRAPEWIRHDLLSKDPGVRRRAEEALAAMIAAGLRTDIERTQ
ncbi:DUF6771 family protein [Sphingomonas morindae]|uniref:Uncharacterized protein n=1 Tax=Sphingomonas morindae TaxID=1541170 RepID=A0ABY4X9V3_9SPHN|nr:DUF6771 family protein [Sphingomonas morindae]USI73521.1 hypothetical protein LHA26_03300 [Sphingomonas morindae]